MSEYALYNAIEVMCSDKSSYLHGRCGRNGNGNISHRKS